MSDMTALLVAAMAFAVAAAARLADRTETHSPESKPRHPPRGRGNARLEAGGFPGPSPPRLLLDRAPRARALRPIHGARIRASLPRAPAPALCDRSGHRYGGAPRLR